MSVNSQIVSRIAISQNLQSEFETKARNEMKKAHQREAGSIVYVLARRSGPASGLFPAVPEGVAEYILLTAFRDDASESSHAQDLTWLQDFTEGPILSERQIIDEGSSSISRDYTWGDGKPGRGLGMLRFRIRGNEEALGEEYAKQAARQMALVWSFEPTTEIYTMTKRPAAGSSLLAKSPSNNLEFFQFSAYHDDDAWQQHRVVEYREGWSWGPTFKTYLEAPLEIEAFPAPQIIGGFTRDAQWGKVIDVAKVDEPD